MAFSGLSALERLETLFDPRSIEQMERAPSGSVVRARGKVAGRTVVAVASDGHVRGGTIGVAEAAVLAQALGEAQQQGANRPAPVLLCLDTGGVRVEEGPRALAATSAAGVLLAECSLVGPPIVLVVSGPRGCFGAPAVMAALSDRVIMTEGSHWGLTGPKLFPKVQPEVSEQEGWQATSASRRLEAGDAHELVANSAAAVSRAVQNAVEALFQVERSPLHARMQNSAAVVMQRRFQWRSACGGWVPPQRRRRRRILEYSLRGQWLPHTPIETAGLAQVGWGRLADREALGVIIGPEDSTVGGIGVEEIAVVLQHLERVSTLPAGDHALILNCIFCQGHAVDVAQERLGLPRILAECLRVLVAVRLLGHRIVTVLGGGTYGAAYLAFAAPSHRILAIRGTRIAPMAPDLLRAFQRLKGGTEAADPRGELADLIPEVRIVESVLRLPKALREEVVQLEAARRTGGAAA